MNFANLDSLVGNPQIGAGGLTVDAAPRLSQGTILDYVDSWWGGGEAIYCRANGTIAAFGLCVFTPTFDTTLGCWRFDATQAPNTANLGRAVGVSQAALTAGQYGWFVISGLTPINSTANVAADTSFGITAAGQVGAVAAGKQILNGRIIAPSTTAVVKAGVAFQSGTNSIQLPNAEGWFPGIVLSGTGIPANTTILNISPDGKTAVISANTTAQAAGNITGTYQGGGAFYNVAHLNRPFAQGAIT